MSIEQGTLVSRTAQELARLSLEQEEGAFIGAEEDLLKRLGVSRPTLRQAAKIAENDRMIDVRRGIRGGFYASRPNADDAIRTLARFLRLRGATLGQIMDVSRLVGDRAAELACGCTDPALRARLKAFLAAAPDDSRAGLLSSEHELAGLISEMSGNPTIELVMAIGYSFGMDEEGSSLFRDPEQRQQARKLQRDLARAVFEGEPDMARLMMQRRSEALHRWIGE